MEIIKKSKWTFHIVNADGVKIGTAKSMVKAEALLKELTPTVQPQEEEKEKEELAPTVRPKLKKVEKSVAPMTIKQFTIELMRAGLCNGEIVEKVQLKFPNSSYKNSHVSWYRSRLIRDETIPEEFSARNMRAKLKNQKGS